MEDQKQERNAAVFAALGVQKSAKLAKAGPVGDTIVESAQPAPVPEKLQPTEKPKPKAAPKPKAKAKPKASKAKAKAKEVEAPKMEPMIVPSEE